MAFPRYPFSPDDVSEVFDGQLWKKVDLVQWAILHDPGTPSAEVLVFGVKFQGESALTVWREQALPPIKVEVLP